MEIVVEALMQQISVARGFLIHTGGVVVVVSARTGNEPRQMDGVVARHHQMLLVHGAAQLADRVQQRTSNALSAVLCIHHQQRQIQRRIVCVLAGEKARLPRGVNPADQPALRHRREGRTSRPLKAFKIIGFFQRLIKHLALFRGGAQ